MTRHRSFVPWGDTTATVVWDAVAAGVSLRWPNVGMSGAMRPSAGWSARGTERHQNRGKFSAVRHYSRAQNGCFI